jgi:dGTPase
MQRDDARELRNRQRELVTELVAGLADRPGELEPGYRAAYVAADGDATRLRVVVDQVASLTDHSAYTLRRRLHSM